MTCSRNSAESRVSSWMSISDCSHIAPRRCASSAEPPSLPSTLYSQCAATPGLGHRVHGLGAHLELHRRAQRADQRGVQRLVAVGLGDGDEVLEAPRHRLVQLVQHAQREVTLGLRRHDDAEAEDIADLREAGVLLAHLAVDRIDGLLAAADLDLDLGGGKGLLDVAAHALDDVAAVAARALHRLGQRAVAPRVQVLEGQLLQLAVDLVQAQPVRDRRIDVERLAGDALALVGRHRLHRAHVVQPVGQLDQDDAHVARHRQQHLAEGLGLAFLAGVELQLVQLGQAVHQLGGGRAEALDQLGLGDALVLDRVVHQRGHDGLHVELPVGAQAGHRDRVRDVGLAAGAELAEVRLVGELEGLEHLLVLGLGQVASFSVSAAKDATCGLFGAAGADTAPLQPLQRRGQQFGGQRPDAHAANLTGLPAEHCAEMDNGRPKGARCRRRTAVQADSDRHLAQHLNADLAGGDLAQRGHARLVRVSIFGAWPWLSMRAR